MVTWGNNTTTVFGTGQPSAFGGGGGVTPSTPPAASTPAPTNPPPLGGGGWNNSNTTTTNKSSAWGQPPAPAGGGLFGAPAPAPPIGGGLFGSTATNSAPVIGGMFGSTPAPAPAGLFGSTPSPAGLFGGFGTQQQQQQPQQQQANPFSDGLFGTQQPQQQQQQQHQYLASSNPHQAALHAHQSASQRQEVARLEEAIYNVHSRYSSHAPDPTNPTITSNHLPSSKCAFTAIFYDELPPEYRYQGQLAVPRPAHILNTTWTEALARNPNPNDLVPVALVGATALHSRIVHQQERATTLANHASKLSNTIEYLQESATTSSTEIMTNITTNQESLQRRLLHIMRKVEILRCMGQPTQRAEMDAFQRLGEILKQVNIVGQSLINLEERGKQQSRSWRMKGASLMLSQQQQHNNSTLSMNDDDDDKLALFHVLNDQRLGLEHLGHIMKKDGRDVGIVLDELSKVSSSSSSGNKVKALSGASIFGVR